MKVAVVERHKNTGHIGVGFIKGYGLKRGSVATSISHDSHNIIVVGENEEDMAFAVNKVREQRGGIAVVDNGRVLASLPLEIAGLMTNKPLLETNSLLENAKTAAEKLGVSERGRSFYDIVLYEPYRNP